ncbi:hypothetical protein [Lysinibacillus capsici]|uniref:hypothetical protein n=1 Tax=Lysinibacillus capsici TaxID=2115968 RepID=UPI0034E58254
MVGSKKEINEKRNKGSWRVNGTERRNKQKNKEFNIAFSMLDEEAQESALALLRALHLEQITKVNWVGD